MPINDVGSLLLDPNNVRAGSQTGIDGQAQIGDSVIYDNAAQLANGDWVGVRVTISGKSHIDLRVDLTNPTQNQVFFLNANGNAAMRGETVDLSFDFIEMATGDPIVLSGTGTVSDIDNNGGGAEYVSLVANDYVSYGLSPGSSLQVQQTGGQLIANGTEFNNPSDQDAWFQFGFEDKSQINMTLTSPSGGAGYGLNGTDIVPVNIIQIQHAPEISGDDSGTAVEAGNLDDGAFESGTSVVNGTLVATDVDAGATATWSGSGAGTYGTFAVDSSGGWTYTLDNNAAATQALKEGQSVTETFTVTVVDDDGLSDTQDVTITVHGTNDVPVVTTAAGQDEGAVTEAGSLDDGTPVAGTPTATGTVTSSDVDADATATWSGGGAGLYGDLVIDPNTGVWTFTLDNGNLSTDPLEEGQVVTEEFFVTVTDEFGASANEKITITINGTNDAPVITTPVGGNTGTVTEDGHDANCDEVPGNPNAAGALTSTDMDKNSTATWSGGGNGTYGTLRVDPDTGVWTYLLDNELDATEALAGGNHAFDTFTVTVTDDKGAIATQDVVIRVNGSDDGDCDDVDVTEDIWLSGVHCDRAANQFIETEWKYHGGSDKLALYVDIPLDAFFDASNPYVFENIDVQPYVDAFNALGITVDPDDIHIDVSDDQIKVKIVGHDGDLTPAEVAGLPDRFETNIGVSEHGVVRQLKVCMGIDEVKVYSPIAFDLNDTDEIEVTGHSTAQTRVDNAVSAQVYFDIDADGTLDFIEWLDGSGDGFLVDNRDGHAAVDMDGSRLFGDEGGTYANGYAKLALLDANSDGQLTGDELVGLNLWVDDGDAIVEDGELQILNAYGVDTISVEVRHVYNQDNEVLLQSDAIIATSLGDDGIEVIAPDDIRITAAAGRIEVSGTDDDDRFNGTNDNEVFVGGEGDDRMDGRKGDDALFGEGGNDRLEGGRGSDNLFGGTGDDTLTGGKGHDTFVFNFGSGNDEITDFDLNEDRLAFVEGITEADLVVTDNGNDQYLVSWGTSDSVLIHVDDHGNAVTAASLMSADAGSGEPADLLLSNTSANLDVLTEDDDLIIFYNVENQGDENARTETNFYFSDDDVFDAGDVLLETNNNGTMKVGEVDAELTVIDFDDLADQADSGFVIAVVDGENEIIELNEANNIAVFEYDLIV